MKTNTLFTPLEIGAVSLRNRIVMAPTTRMRAKMPGNIPWELNATYYSQRASAGLIITEATPSRRADTAIFTCRAFIQRHRPTVGNS